MSTKHWPLDFKGNADLKAAVKDTQIYRFLFNEAKRHLGVEGLEKSQRELVRMVSENLIANRYLKDEQAGLLLGTTGRRGVEHLQRAGQMEKGLSFSANKREKIASGEGFLYTFLLKKLAIPEIESIKREDYQWLEAFEEARALRANIDQSKLKETGESVALKGKVKSAEKKVKARI